jgi:diguanylate cyclase (GGDEF)-like protein/PAS domain S-box-containing protein
MELNAPSSSGSADSELEQLYELLYLLPVGVVAFDSTGSVNRATPLSVQLLNPFVAPADISNAFRMLAPLVPNLETVIAEDHGGTVVLGNHRSTLEANGRITTVEVSIHRPRPGYYVAVLSDVTELVHREHELRRERDRIRLIVEMVREYAIYTIDRSGFIDSWNASGQRLFGLSASQAIGRSLDQVVTVDRLPDVLDAAIFAGWRRTEGWTLSSPGEAFYTDTMISTLVDETGEPEGFIIVTRDTTEMQRREEDLRREADTDPLTKLANRRGFHSRADRLLKACAINDVPAAVLMLDIDHFKAVNDTHGHDAGDLVLCAVGASLAGHLHTIDLLARFGGEEFAVLMPGADVVAASGRAEALRAAIENLAVEIAPGTTVGVTISIGAAQYDQSLPDTFQRADAALYEAKDNGRNRVVLDRMPVQP